MEKIVQLVTGDLRMALLLVGVIVLLAIVLWEVLQRRRVAQAERSVLKGPLGQSREIDDLAVQGDPLFRNERTRVETIVRDEPTLTLPEIQVRDRLVEPPLVDLEVALTSHREGPGLPVVEASRDREPQASSAPMTSSKFDSEAAPKPRPALGPNAAFKAAPKLELPSEEKRVIVAVRVVARSGERFTGASLRQALQGDGFVHGEMSIFHRSVGEGQVLLSAASLTKPGSFDLDTMDSSLFLGINLFAVLPGPLPGRDTVDKLLLSGHTLAQRLRGELQDAHGQVLNEARLTEMRREAASVDGAL